MKLVEILAKELSEWPDDMWSAIGQAKDGDLHAEPFSGRHLKLGISVAEDHMQAIVSRNEWQAERDRQKGGEWKRHRGNKLPIDGGLYIEAKLRCGDIQRGFAQDFIWPHAACDVEVNLMKYRVISQPQEEEVEMIKVDPVVAANVEEFNGQWQIGRVDGPLAWRDTVNELNAYIEEFTRERDELINRLADEGFALIPAMTAVMGVADVSMPIDQWQIGDILEVVARKGANSHEFEIGEHVRIDDFDLDDDNLPVKCYALDDSDYWYIKYDEAKFIRRP